MIKLSTVLMMLSALPLAFAFTSLSQAATYYVDQSHPQASDRNTGTEVSPWKTINHAATVLHAGDTVLVKGGTYNVGASPSWSEPAVNPSHSGTQDSPITFKAYPGHEVKITTSGGQAAIGSADRSYIIWDGFVVDMANREKGVLVWGGKGCVIRYCEVIGNYMSIGDNHDGIRIQSAEDCIIHHTIIRGVKGKSPNSSGIKLYSKGIQNVVIEDNYIYDNTAGVFDKDSGIRNTYRRNLFTGNETQFYGNNQGMQALYFIYDNVFDGKIALHARNTGSEIHDNFIRAQSLTGAWAGGISSIKIWNNIVISKSSSIKAFYDGEKGLADQIEYMDYNVYDAAPYYNLSYNVDPERYSLSQMQSKGYEKNSQVVASLLDVFEDEKSHRLLPKWRAAGRHGDAIGPENIALILDLSRYGPSGRMP